MTWRVPERLPEALLTGAVVFAPLAFGSVEPWSLAILSISVSAALFSCALVHLPDYRNPIYRTVIPCVLAILLIGLVQRFNPRSILEPASLLPTTASAYATTRALWIWGTYFAVLWCAAQVFDRVAAMRRLVNTLFALGIAVSLIGIIQMTQASQLIYGFRAAEGFEPFGPYYNRDHAGSLLIMAIFCGIGVLWDRFIQRREVRDRTDVFNFAAVQGLIVFGIGVIAVGVFYTQSRGALASLLVVSLALGIIGSWPKKIRFVWLGLGAAVIFSAISRAPVAIRLTRYHFEKAFDFRFSLYRAGLDVLSDFPSLGTGLGAFQQAYYPYQSTKITGLVEHAHNDWLELLVQVGLPALAVCIVGVALFLRSRGKMLVSPDRRASLGLTCGTGAAAVAFLLHGLGDFSFQIPANAVVFFVLLAAGSGATGRDKTEVSRTAFPSHVNMAIALAATLLAVFSARPAVASWYDLRSKGNNSSSRVWHLSKVITYDDNPKYRYELALLLAAQAHPQSSERTDILRIALAHSEAALRSDSANPRYSALQGDILRQLGRVADGNELSGTVRSPNRE